MTTTMTHSMMQDLASPYADLERLPRLTAEEEAQLLHDLRFAHQAHDAKQRLIEGYLPRVLTLARQYDRQYRVITFDDLVQEGSLALMGAIDKCATMPITTSLSAYVGTVVHSAFARAIATDAPIHMPNSTWHYIHNTGRAHEYAWMQPATPVETPLPSGFLLPRWSCLPASLRSSSHRTSSAVSWSSCCPCSPSDSGKSSPCATG
jgi:DNA-directed RNA polymerase specialized sigma24 family protein